VLANKDHLKNNIALSNRSHSNPIHTKLLHGKIHVLLGHREEKRDKLNMNKEAVVND